MPEEPFFVSLTSTSPEFPTALEAAVERGYRFRGMYVEAGQTTVLVEKWPDPQEVRSGEKITELR